MGWTILASDPGVGTFFCTSSDIYWGPPKRLYNGYRVIPRDESGWGVTLTTHTI
jgi:hypothetical protein